MGRLYYDKTPPIPTELQPTKEEYYRLWNPKMEE